MSRKKDYYAFVYYQYRVHRFVVEFFVTSTIIPKGAGLGIHCGILKVYTLNYD